LLCGHSARLPGWSCCQVGQVGHVGHVGQVGHVGHNKKFYMEKNLY